MTWKEGANFNFQRVILETGFFEVKSRIPNGKMSGSGESDTFYLYEKLHNMDNKLLTSRKQTKVFLSKIGVPDVLATNVINTYFDEQQNTFDIWETHNHSSEEGWRAYYEQLAR